MNRPRRRAITPPSLKKDYFLSDVPWTLWSQVQAVADQEGISVRALLLRWIESGVRAAPRQPTHPSSP